MNTVIWNARGLGGQRAFHGICCLISESSPDLFFIYELKLCRPSVDVLRARLKFHNCFNVDAKGRKGNLILLWNENINVSILSYSVGHIDCMITYPPSQFYFIGFYGNPNAYLRTHSWSLLDKIEDTHTNKNIGWLVEGDFKKILL